MQVRLDPFANNLESKLIQNKMHYLEEKYN